MVCLPSRPATVRPGLMEVNGGPIAGWFKDPNLDDLFKLIEGQENHPGQEIPIDYKGISQDIHLKFKYPGDTDPGQDHWNIYIPLEND